MNINEMKTKEIKELILKLEVVEYDKYIKILLEDQRASVNKLGESLKRQKKKHDDLVDRFNEMRNFDLKAAGDLNLACGISSSCYN